MSSAPAEIDREQDRDTVQAFARGLGVFRAFTARQPRLTLTEVAEATGMTRASARRFLLTLVQEGYVGTDGRYFSLRPKVLDLGFSALATFDIRDAAQPVMRELAERLRESVFLAVLDEDAVVYLARASGNRLVSVDFVVGKRIPAYMTSTGRILLAHLDAAPLEAYLARARLEPMTARTTTSAPALRAALLAARAQGWALVEEEMEVGLISLSVPIRDARERVVAALNIGSPTARVDVARMRGEILPALQEAAQAISMVLAR